MIYDERSTVGGGNVVKPPLTLQLEDAKTQGFSSYSNTYPFNYLFGDKELLASRLGQVSSYKSKSRANANYLSTHNFHCWPRLLQLTYVSHVSSKQVSKLLPDWLSASFVHNT